MNTRVGLSLLLVLSALAASCYPTNSRAAYIKQAPRTQPAFIPDEWLADCYAFIAVYDFSRACKSVPPQVQLQARRDLEAAFEELRAARIGIPAGEALELGRRCTRDRAMVATAMAAARCELDEPNWLSTP